MPPRVAVLVPIMAASLGSMVLASATCRVGLSACVPGVSGSAPFGTTTAWAAIVSPEGSSHNGVRRADRRRRWIGEYRGRVDRHAGGVVRECLVGEALAYCGHRL
jgi:hypothetical protein